MAVPAPPSSNPPRLTITRDGTWLHEGEEVTHAGILANLWSNLRVDAEGHHLQVGPVRVPVEVEDAPFVIVRVEPEEDRLVMTLNDLTREALAPATLSFAADGVPHCRVKHGRFTARLSRPATYQLLQHVEYDEAGGGATLLVGAARYPVSAPPGAHD
jgi:hypothetical protein